MVRDSLIKRIDEYNSIIEREFQKGDIPRLNVHDYEFPETTWMLSLVFLAWWGLGHMVHSGVHDVTAMPALLIGMCFVLWASIQNVRVLRRLKQRKTNRAIHDTEAIRKVARRRRKLQNRLRWLDDVT